jgi:hypothetical protein
MTTEDVHEKVLESAAAILDKSDMPELTAAIEHCLMLKKDHKLAIDNLTRCQERCNELFDANRGYRLDQYFDLVLAMRWRLHVRPPTKTVVMEIYDRMGLIDKTQKRAETLAEIAALCLLEIERMGTVQCDPPRTVEQQAKRERSR